MAQMRFEEKILYKCQQHWIIPSVTSLKLTIFIIVPITVILWFLTDFSTIFTVVWFFILLIIIVWYEYFLWKHSWLFIGNQKVTLSVRNWIFSQYAMNIRYRNIRDSAVSKNSMIWFMLKYGTLFIRSTNSEWDFIAKYVPKVGKVYALINALSRYSDDERTDIETIEQLHTYHTNKEFSWKRKWEKSLDMITVVTTIKNIAWVVDVIELSPTSRAYIRTHEETRNHAIMEVLSREHVVCFLHNADFRDPESPLVFTDSSGEISFPPVSFSEIPGNSVVSGSPSDAIHTYLLRYFPYATEGDASILVGWDS
jgi:hypothetical protein